MVRLILGICLAFIGVCALYGMSIESADALNVRVGIAVNTVVIACGVVLAYFGFRALKRERRARAGYVMLFTGGFFAVEIAVICLVTAATKSEHVPHFTTYMTVSVALLLAGGSLAVFGFRGYLMNRYTLRKPRFGTVLLVLGVIQSVLCAMAIAGASLNSEQDPDFVLRVAQTVTLFAMGLVLVSLGAWARGNKRPSSAPASLDPQKRWEKQMDDQAKAMGMRGFVNLSAKAPELQEESQLTDVTGKCDICNAPTSTSQGATVIALATMKQATANGFNGMAFGAQSEFMKMMGMDDEEAREGWKRQVMTDTSDYLLCPQCLERIRKHLPR